MTGGNAFSPGGGRGCDALSSNPNLEIIIEEGSQISEQLLEDESNDLELEGSDLGIDGNDLDIESNDLDIEDNEPEIESDGVEIEGNDLENDCKQILNTEGNDHENERDDGTVVGIQNDISQGNNYPPPVIGMEFESYDDAYNYYNCYAKELGFAIRVKSSWTKRNSKEKRGAVLCCNCEGFKTVKEANSRRKETRTGCLAMIRLRLVESDRWRVDEVKLEHNHLFDPERAQNSKSHKKMEVGNKRKVEHTIDVEVQTIKLYRTPVVDLVGYGNSDTNEAEISINVDRSKRLKLRKGDAQEQKFVAFAIVLTSMGICADMHYWFDHLYRRAMQVVGEGMISQDHYMVAWQSFKESLNKVRLVADKHV
ncbi:hypothetical protein JRO89_XS09G0105800 [Xanthoceras sorbifolium]|uniref:FAR1 domain-containing protein n=1 Tax=Xanthoceras sorbifolium TaxID=99658 RepID=A0ABQ8HL23_9ROSI|nr:hypothetical protein JRO89_XS09G0105800 [Xanthoceras sorbifolium]